ncbi:hypothetical protein SFUMM280S_00330 [Streptomyces fumanus]
MDEPGHVPGPGGDPGPYAVVRGRQQVGEAQHGPGRRGVRTAVRTVGDPVGDVGQQVGALPLGQPRPDADDAGAHGVGRDDGGERLGTHPQQQGDPVSGADAVPPQAARDPPYVREERRAGDLPAQVLEDHAVARRVEQVQDRPGERLSQGTPSRTR